MRLSGSDARRIAESILRFRSGHAWVPWTTALAELIDDSGASVDQVVVAYFAAPRSYTAEDLVEISCHGSPVILRCCLERACAAGARLAEPGEFTLRAYLNGRIDLPRAEAVRDLIEATTLYQARIAAQQVEGSVSKRIRPIKEQLLELIALLEAGIDFAEDDISVAPVEEILRRLDPIDQALAGLVSTFDYGKLVHSGITLAIVGRPNVGKSSLFNRLLEQDRAIVTDIPGTTRDLVESLGVQRSYQAMADADLTLVVLDLAAPPHPDDLALIDRARSQGRWILVGNKADLPRSAAPMEPFIPVSALTGEGIARLREEIAPMASLEQESGFITSVRHEQLLRESLEALAQARKAADVGIPHEMLLLDLYAALRPLDAITGATTADDILNRIFSTFCIGK